MHCQYSVTDLTKLCIVYSVITECTQCHYAVLTQCHYAVTIHCQVLLYSVHIITIKSTQCQYTVYTVSLCLVHSVTMQRTQYHYTVHCVTLYRVHYNGVYKS